MNVKAKFAASLRALIARRPVVDLSKEGGPSKSYLYRMLKGEANPSLEQIDVTLRAYGSSLSEFFASWHEGERVERQLLATRARTALQRVLDNEEIDITILRQIVESLRIADDVPRSSR